MEAGRGCLSSRSEPLVHWERLINKRTRIQIRKAQSWGCRGNLQQAPSLSGVGAGTCQAQLPLPLSPPPQALPSSAWTTGEGQGHREAGLGSHYCFSQITPLQEGGYPQGPQECSRPPHGSPTTQAPAPTTLAQPISACGNALRLLPGPGPQSYYLGTRQREAVR